MKHFFNWRNVFGVLYLYGFMALLGSIGLQFDLLNVIDDVLQDYNLTDVYYAKIRDNQSIQVDTNIVLVNIGDLPREGIAEQINIINKYEPAVIGIDAFFRGDRLADVDSALALAIKNTKHFVMASRVYACKEETQACDSLELSNPKFSSVAEHGFANIIGDPGYFSTWRDVSPKEKMKNGQYEPCMAAKIVSFYDSAKYAKFMKRSNEAEEIYFRGNWDKFSAVLDVDDVFNENFDPSVIKGKIVLMGFMGKNYRAPSFEEDRFYTPLNEKQVGRTYPDMYGVVVHANIISMILNETYVNPISSVITSILALVLCYMNVALFSYIQLSEKWTIWYDALTKLLQLVQIIAMLFIVVYLFANYRIKLDLSLAFFVILLAGDVVSFYIAVVLTIVHKIRQKFQAKKEEVVINSQPE